MAKFLVELPVQEEWVDGDDLEANPFLRLRKVLQSDSSGAQINMQERRYPEAIDDSPDLGKQIEEAE